MVIFNSYVCLPEGISFELQKRHLNLPEPPGTKFLPPSSLTHILCPLKPATDHTEKEWKGPDGHKNLRSPLWLSRRPRSRASAWCSSRGYPVESKPMALAKKHQTQPLPQKVRNNSLVAF
jgi:hypothetical protein